MTGDEALVKKQTGRIDGEASCSGGELEIVLLHCSSWDYAFVGGFQWYLLHANC